MYNYTVRINAIKEGGKNNSECGIKNGLSSQLSTHNWQLVAFYYQPNHFFFLLTVDKNNNPVYNLINATKWLFPSEEGRLLFYPVYFDLGLVRPTLIYGFTSMVYTV